MRTTDITTKDRDIDVVLGDHVFSEDPRKEAFHSLKYLYTDLTDIRKYYMRLGFHLAEFKAYGYYKDFGYLTLEEFCDVNLGLDKGAVSRCINVYEQFNASNDVRYGAGVKSIGCAMDLSEHWKDYSYTQLCEILPLSEEDRKKVTPDMTIKEIRDFKKSLKESNVPVASTQPKKKPFDLKRYESTQGIVRQDIVRDCDALNEDVGFKVFDKNGRFLGGNIVCDLIYKDEHDYYFRLCQSHDGAQKEG